MNVNATRIPTTLGRAWVLFLTILWSLPWSADGRGTSARSALMFSAPIAPATLSDFGHQNIRVNGQLSLRPRPLVMILANFAGGQPFANTDFDALVFDTQSTLGVAGYFREVSNGRFSWSRAGIIGPVQFTAAESDANHLDDPKGISFVIRRAAQASSFNFAQFDANADGTVSQDELGILIITNQGDGLGGAARPIDPSGCLQVPGSSLRICGDNIRVTAVGHRASFMTLCHELSHQLGTLDLYGNCQCLNQDLTLMDGTLYPNPYDRRTYHLDPWHKTQLGWSDPRIQSLRDGGIVSLPATQVIRPDAPVILYDPQRGTGEFFILEYRTQSRPGAGGYDQNVTGNGLAIWHIQQDADKNPTLIPNQGYAVFHQGAPDFKPGGDGLWESGVTTPYLRWLDGSQTRVKIKVRPFKAEDPSITVELLNDDEVWVDFNYGGPTRLGTFDSPYNTLAEGLKAVPYGGTLKIKAGSRNEAAAISKAMRIEAYGGTVTIGQ